MHLRTTVLGTCVAMVVAVPVPAAAATGDLSSPNVISTDLQKTSAALTRAAVFAPGVISGPANDAAATFAPDGRTVYFFRSNREDYDIMVSHLDGTRWPSPRIASFSGHWRDLEPAMSPDGSFLIFASSRPIDGGRTALDGSWGGHVHAGKGGNLWRVDRQGAGWSKPVRLPGNVNRVTSTFSPAIAGDGSLYFMAASGDQGRFRLYRAAPDERAYATPQPLSFSTGEWSDVDPAIAPDQSFIVFSSNRPPASGHGSDLFLALRDHGGWGAPIDLGPTVNNPDGTVEARLGPDAHTLYFTTSHVVAPAYPKTDDTAASGLQQMQDWNNGSANIWTIDLSPWLQSHAKP